MRTGSIPLFLLGLTMVGPPVAVAQTGAAAAPVAAEAVTRLEARVLRLEQELREQKQLLLQVMQADQQRHDLIAPLVRSTEASRGNGSTTLPPPPPPARPMVKAEPTAGAPALVTISGLVSGLQGSEDAYVYLEGRGPVSGPRRAAEIKQEGTHFDPPVTVVPVGTRVTFPNLDIVFHNVFSRTPGSVFDLGTIKGGERGPPLTLSRPGHIEIFCNIHSKMRADILVVPNAHFARVRPDGSFALSGVPAGSRKLVLWGPRLKPASQPVEVRPGVSVSFTAEAADARVHMNKYGKAYGSYDE